MAPAAEPLLQDLRSAVRADPATAGLFCDFDGTLAPIVDDPSAVTPQPGAFEVLERLRASGVTVVVVSGRPLDVLVRHLPASVDLVGLYGLEWRRDGTIGEDPEASTWAAAVASLAAEARDALAGARVEDKRLSLTLHWREAPALEPAVRSWAESAAQRSGFVARDAKSSMELHPPTPLDKGSAVAARAAGLATVLFCGDDRGDLAAFDALDGAAAAGALTVRVAVAGPEAPPDLVERADVTVDGPAGVVALLESLLD